VTSIVDYTRLAAGGLKDFATGLVEPTLRLGVTGLSRSGKTVFITAFVSALLNKANLPLFEVQARGRIARSHLAPQPDDRVPRFPFEENLNLMKGEARRWPQGTTRLSQLRLTIEYEPQTFFSRRVSGGRLHIDIIDYPGEWLLDLPLMKQTYEDWSRKTIEASNIEPRAKHAAVWLKAMEGFDAFAPANELKAVELSRLFTAYLQRCREADVSLSALPPGRFLMPGDLEGSPLLSFAPLPLPRMEDAMPLPSGTMASLMARRYESYVAHVVKPFFFDHFSRLDRQIVLVDAMSALNAGRLAVADLENALTDVVSCFRQGKNSVLWPILGKKIDRVMFAATKADLLHHRNHDRLEAILRTLTDRASLRASAGGARIDVAALAAVRATREATVKQRGEELSCIAGIPEAGENLGETNFDGLIEAAIFPGDLPANPAQALDGSLEGKLKFIRFRPPEIHGPNLPHIRLDRAIDYLIGDRFS
jgi:uncharacterized protein